MLKNLIIASALAVAPINNLNTGNSKKTATWYDTISIWTPSPNNSDSQKEYIRQKTAFRNQYFEVGGANIYQKALEYQYFEPGSNYLKVEIVTITKIVPTAYSLNEIKMDFTSTVNNPIPLDENDGEYYIYKKLNQNDLIDENTYIETFLTTNNYRDDYSSLDNIYDQTVNVNLINNTVDITNIENIGTYTLDINVGNINNSIYILSLCRQNFDTTDLEIDTMPLQNYANVYETTRYEITYRYETDEQGEIVDLPGLMFTVLGMPFAFMSQAFDLTIFPNTYYAVNVSHIFVALLSALILIVIIKKILK